MQIFTTLLFTAILFSGTGLISVYGKSCCLRSAEKESLSDGLSLQIALLTNISPENKDLWFIPNSPRLLLNSKDRQLVMDLLTLIKRSNSLVTDEAILQRVMKAVIKDACKLITRMLNTTVDCKNISEIEAMISKFELFESVRAMNKLFNYPRSALFTPGSSKNRYAYWDEHVIKSCTPCTCPRFKEVEAAIHFPTNSDICTCS